MSVERFIITGTILADRGIPDARTFVKWRDYKELLNRASALKAKNDRLTEALAADRDRQLSQASHGAVTRPSYSRVIEIVQDTYQRIQAAGESHRMFARWVSEALDAEIYAPASLESAAPGREDAGEGAMSPEEIRLENLKQMAAYSGPIVCFEVREPYYLASCDHCGWVGSSEACGSDSFGDDSDVYCPRCFASGADCGKIAARLASPPTGKDAVQAVTAVPEAWELEAAAIFMDHVDDDETGSVHRVAAFLRSTAVLQQKETGR